MSRKFEEEYKEYLNAQAPDLWSRIEAEIDAVPSAAVSKKRRKKRGRIRYQNYRALVSVAACLFALIIIVPVYLLVKPSGKSADATESAGEMMLADVTIQNIEVETKENALTVEEAACEETATDDVTEIEVEFAETEERTEEITEMVQSQTEISDFQETDGTGLASGAPDGMAAASDTPGMTIREEVPVTEAAQEETSVSETVQEEMDVMILSDGESCENGMLYTAALVSDENSAPIQLFVPTGSDITFEKDKTYTVTVERMTDGNYKVVVCFA